MRASAFVPGHISCVFRPVRDDNVAKTGSLGFGIRLNLGCMVKVAARDDRDIVIRINRRESDAPITRAAIEHMGPVCGFDIDLEHMLPMEQGFGTSASGTYGAALCAASIMGKDRRTALEATHRAECTLGGGLGDLMAIESGFGVPIRESPGLDGRTSDSGLRFRDLTLIVFDEPLRTGSVLSDRKMMERISEAGDIAMREFSEESTVPGLFKASNRFSESIGIESDEIRDALTTIKEKGYNAGMCMLGNSIYTDLPEPSAKRLFRSARVFEAASFAGPVEVTRKA
jgi:pantoate kinase